MGVYRNDNSHGIQPVGVNQRVRAGGVLEASGDTAKELDSMPGVTKLTGDEAKQAVAAQRAADAGPSSDKSGDQLLQEAVVEGRTELRRSDVAAPLQRVVGDDEAPLGPPTGVTSTKREEAGKGLAERIAFADHEAVDEVDLGDAPAVTPHGAANSQVVHNAQARAGDEADEVAREQIDTLEAAKSPADEE